MSCANKCGEYLTHRGFLTKTLWLYSLISIWTSTLLLPEAFADISFTANLDRGQEVSRIKEETPSLPHQAMGNAQLTYKANSQQVCYTIRFEQLVGKETEVHVHAPAPIGENAPVLFFISPQEAGGPSPIGSPKKGCMGPLNKQEVRWLKRGLWYLNIHTNQFPGGEIRGQVLQNLDNPEQEK